MISKSPFAGAIFLTTTMLLGGCNSAPEEAINACSGTEQTTSRFLLQQLSADRAIIKWRGDADSVCIGENPDNLTRRADAAQEELHKIVRFAGLKPDRKYYYSVGGASRAQADHYFWTAPATGDLPADGNTRIWISGDSGTAAVIDDETGEPEFPWQAEAVKTGAQKYIRENGGEPIDLLLILGDNAYPAGTDDQWQVAFFDLYTDILRNTQTIPTIGNHEMGVGEFDMCVFRQVPACAEGPVMFFLPGSSKSSDPASYDSTGDGPDENGLPYLNIFTLPASAEMGGVPSGTEQYYSMDYGNLHIVSLDSQLSNADPDQRRAMRDWLIDDLQSNKLDWTVVIFHHPPYSKGVNHDSDEEQGEIDMREMFTAVFEDHGVDVVYSGHAHSYERSWYLNGHYGLSETFDASKHAETDADGNPTFGFAEAPYQQISPSSGFDDKAVYTVAGNSGQITDKEVCEHQKQINCYRDDWLSHPAHRSFEISSEIYKPNGVHQLGSVLLDVSDRTLTSRFIDHQGQVLDHFVIKR